MASKLAIALGATLALAAGSGAALAQLDGADQDSFYAEPQMADPPQKPVHAFAASVATEDVAAVTPAISDPEPVPAKPVQTARNARPAPACTAMQPCATPTPAART